MVRNVVLPHQLPGANMKIHLIPSLTLILLLACNAAATPAPDLPDIPPAKPPFSTAPPHSPSPSSSPTPRQMWCSTPSNWRGQASALPRAAKTSPKSCHASHRGRVIWSAATVLRCNWSPSLWWWPCFSDGNPGKLMA